MDIKVRLQRVLQILEESESAGSLSELEKDIALNELREVYAELKYSDERRETRDESAACEINAPTILVAPTIPTEEVKSEPEVESELEAEEESEPEVEVELIFEEEVSEETESGKPQSENEELIAESGVSDAANDEQSEIAPIAPNTPNVHDEELNKECAEQEELSSLVSCSSPKKRSALLSLYEDEVAPVLGEQFREQPSVADAIARPKGVAESTPVVSLRDAIGVADRFMLIRELFDGDADAYERAIDRLEAQPSFDDCVIFISENYAWRAQSEGVKVMMALLQRKFNS